MPKTVELHDLPQEDQREILDCAVNVGVQIEKIMRWVNAGVAVAVACDTNELEVSGE